MISPYRAEPNIPVRFQLLMEGTFKAVCLPDPLATGGDRRRRDPDRGRYVAGR